MPENDLKSLRDALIRCCEDYNADEAIRAWRAPWPRSSSTNTCGLGSCSSSLVGSAVPRRPPRPAWCAVDSRRAPGGHASWPNSPP